MKKIVNIDSIHQAHSLLGLAKPKHPLITCIKSNEYEANSTFDNVRIVMSLYQNTLKSSNYKGAIKYGKNSYDYDEGTLIFVAPEQAMEYGNDLKNDNDGLDGWTLVFHPDLIRKHDLVDKIHQYSFFNYEISEALHLSDEERKIIEEVIAKIVYEYSQRLDKHSQNLIVSNIELLLDYCLRFYDRQFLTRTNVNSDIVSGFNKILNGYYQSKKHHDLGLPTVKYCGKQLKISPNYLSDLLKKETGKSAQEHIHLFIIEKAKNTLLNSSESISKIGYSLGFEYPQHFSNLFKSKTGSSPKEYRNLN